MRCSMQPKMVKASKFNVLQVWYTCFNTGEFNIIFSLTQVFAGNTDRNTAIVHPLKPHIEAHSIRFHPRTHNHNGPCFRVELYGCRKGEFSRYAIKAYLIKLIKIWKFLKQLWCCVGGGNKVIWLYIPSWNCKLATVTSKKLTFRALALRQSEGLTLEMSTFLLVTVANLQFQFSLIKLVIFRLPFGSSWSRVSPTFSTTEKCPVWPLNNLVLDM